MSDIMRHLPADLILADETGHISIDQAIAAWLHEKRGKSHSWKTEQAYQQLHEFRALLLQVGMDLDGPPNRIALLAQGWADRRKPRIKQDGTPAKRHAGPVAAATYNQRLAILSSFYSFVLKRDLLPITKNPITMVERRTVEAYSTTAGMPLKEVRKKLKAIDRSSLAGKRDYALLLIGLQTGRRASELANLRWEDVQMVNDGTAVLLHFRRTKGGKAQRDLLVPAVTAALLAWIRAMYGDNLAALPGHAPVWASLDTSTRGHPLTIQSIGLICKKHFNTSKVHVLRHIFAQTMEKKGARLSEIQARLGHSNAATTSRYLAALAKEDNPYGDKLAAAYLADDEDEEE